MNTMVPDMDKLNSTYNHIYYTENNIVYDILHTFFVELYIYFESTLVQIMKLDGGGTLGKKCCLLLIEFVSSYI